MDISNPEKTVLFILIRLFLSMIKQLIPNNDLIIL